MRSVIDERNFRSLRRRGSSITRCESPARNFAAEKFVEVARLECRHERVHRGRRRAAAGLHRVFLGLLERRIINPERRPVGDHHAAIATRRLAAKAIRRLKLERALGRHRRLQERRGAHLAEAHLRDRVTIARRRKLPQPGLRLGVGELLRPRGIDREKEQEHE
jgi:hypothetical protein